jgi:sugar/nucleoside kinase (ribokinase family)
MIVLDQIVDEDCGVVNGAVRETLERLAAEDPQKLIFIDSRRFLGLFTAGSLKGNRGEILQAASATGEPSVEPALARLAANTHRAAYCTLGEQGILVAQPRRDPQLAPGFPVAGPIDIVGAGDAATSGIVAALLAGADELEAAALGNLVASITIQQLGTTGTATPSQLRTRLQAAAP